MPENIGRETAELAQKIVNEIENFEEKVAHITLRAHLSGPALAALLRKLLGNPCASNSSVKSNGE